ncbi:MAG: hypothetical protein GYA58_01850 [Anaerolineaceae bacterium]|nr:hypothetical protein [Anaerolineaceae bacterium]
MINWEPNMSTGDDHTDAQHRALIEKFNELSEVFSGTNQAEMRRAAAELLDFLQFYAAWHFEQEEILMEQKRCPLAETNKAAHADFLQRFGDFYTRWQLTNMDINLARATYQSLADWIVNHILTIDVHLRDCL